MWGKQCEQAFDVNARIKGFEAKNRSVYEFLCLKQDKKAEKVRQLEIETREIKSAEVKENKRKRRAALYGAMISLVGILVTVIEPVLSWSEVVSAITNFTNTLSLAGLINQ